MTKNPSEELDWLKNFADKNHFEKYKCEVITMSGSESPTLSLSIPVVVSEDIRVKYYEHLKDVYQFYSIDIKKLTLFDCFFRKKQLNRVHNSQVKETWNG